MTRAVALAFVALLLGVAAAPAPAATPGFRVLVFTKTAGFRHASIAPAIAAIQTLGAQNGFAVDATDDAGAFTITNLPQYRVVVFLLTTGDVLDDNQQIALQRFVEAGGGWVGVHSAADTEYDWPWYGGLLGGAWFKSHPAIQQATVNVEDATDPSTVALPKAWVRTDEWYDFRVDPRSAVHVLATVDETTYDAGPDAMGADHPIAWSHLYDGGRAWYTAGGHTDAAWSEPLFLAHVLGGIKWAAGPIATPATPVARPPSIVSVKAAVQARRAVVTVEHSACACDAQLSVRVRGRALTAKKAAATGTTTRLTSTVLPKGRWQLSVTLTNRPAGKRVVAWGWITVR